MGMRVSISAVAVATVGTILSASGPVQGADVAAAARVVGARPAGVPRSRQRAASPIRHVVLIVQENRTPDNLFHGLPGADIASRGLASKGQLVTLKQVPLATTYDLGHGHPAFLVMYDGGKMDGADRNRVNCYSAKCPGKDAAYAYVRPADVAPYFDLAQTYTFADRMFESNQGPSFPAHQYLIAGTSTPSSGGQYDDDLAAENPRNPGTPTGCVDSPATETVPLIDPDGNENISIYPCFEHATLIDLLDQAGLSWTYYTADKTGIWNGPNAIQHLRTGPDYARVVSPPAQVLADISQGRLADVSWVTPTALESDHSHGNDGTGPSWVASIVNAIGQSAYWSDTAVFITWDDWGGWYDHVAPPIHSSYESGFRVPLVVVSPYARMGYVSHVTHTFGSLLKFIEETYGLPSLGYEDARSDDLSDCFDFGQDARPFRVVPAPHDAAFFIERARRLAPTDPDDD